jgi:hypothetical protein
VSIEALTCSQILSPNLFLSGCRCPDLPFPHPEFHHSHHERAVPLRDFIIYAMNAFSGIPNSIIHAMNTPSSIPNSIIHAMNTPSSIPNFIIHAMNTLSGTPERLLMLCATLFAGREGGYYAGFLVPRYE